MAKFKIIIMLLIFCFTSSLIFGKTKYLITLKGGTKIKADSYIKENGFIKVFKFGGYILYPEKNIKSIKKVYTENSFETFNKKDKTNSNEKNLSSENKANKIEKNCNPIVKNFEARHIYNKEKKNFDLKLVGEILNNCSNYVTNLKMTVHFYNENNEEIFTKILNLDDISPYDSLNFTKIYDEARIGEIKYFNYKLEFSKE